ncbi:MAG: hypothetical protein H7Y07_02690 [Pyrinomonadaceae bacterium]|nr:hypothetical protein [Sphingobacteriaceae bacterium]
MSSTTPETDKDRVFDEFSPKKIIRQIQHVAFYILSKWMIILLVAILFGTSGYVKTYLKEPNYLAEITFALDEGASGGPKSATAALGAQLGIEMETEAGGVFSTMSNIVELLQSRLLIEKTLKSSVVINNKRIVFADFFLDSLDYRDKWLKGNPNKKLNFQNYSTNSKDGLLTSSIINNMHQTLTGEYLSINSKGNGTTILSVTCITEHELFSKYFLEALLNEVTKYYIETKTQRAKINLAFLQRRTDSTRIVYYNTMYGRASFADAHSNPSRQVATVYRDKQQTDIQILKSTYAELVNSLEAAKNTLMKDTPLFQFLDTPQLPLKRFDANAKTSFILFFIVGAFLSVGFFLVKKIFQYLMR